jgi:hypothetical protein
MTITLKHIKTRARQSASASASASASTGDGFDYPSSNLGDYFILILEILAGFLVFCWIATSNYLNTKFIDTDASYPIFGKNKVRDDDNNPYATRFNPGPIDMSNDTEINEKVGLRWWLERTQQSSYQLGGLILHKVFDGLKGFTDKIDESDKPSSTMAARIFTSILRILFDILSVILFISFFGLVFGMWIPGWLGGLTAYLPLTYYSNWKFLKSAFILFWSFVLMCLGGWVVTVFPVIWQFFYLIYLVYVKQLRDDPGRFGTEFLKRMQSLVYIYVLIALIIAFASSELPNPTKITVGIVSAIVIAIQFFMNTPKTE